MESKVIEMDGYLYCTRHNKKVKMVILDNSMSFIDTLYCLTCLDKKETTSKIMTMKQAQVKINERHSNLDAKKEAAKQELQIFQQKIMDARSQFIEKIDQLLRITQENLISLQNLEQKPETLNLLKELEQLYLNSQVKNQDEEDLTFQKLFDFDEFQKCFGQLKSTVIPLQKSRDSEEDEVMSIPVDKINVDSQKLISYKLIQSVKQRELSQAIAFNNSGSIMVAACDEDIKVWNFKEGNLIELQKLKGHNTYVGDNEYVRCLVFSKRFNWFASAGDNGIIMCWKEQVDKDWMSVRSKQRHNSIILCLILNQNEDQLISGSDDNTIKVWQVNCEQNEITFNYAFENKHSRCVCSISMNESETALVSCYKDKQIILWVKGLNKKWEYKSHITQDDYGNRICFISDNQIAWQQESQGITHIFEIENGNLIEKPELKILLNEESDEDSWLFPTIFNKSKQVMIQKYNQYIYIIKKQNNGQFKIESEPIDCHEIENYGALTEDGEYLVNWNIIDNEFRVYKITYDE